MKHLRTLAAATTLTGSLLISSLAYASDQFERWIDVHNNTDVSVRGIYITDADDPRFGDNLIQGYRLRPGQTVTVEQIRPGGYCLVDVRIEYVDGYYDDYSKIDLCEETDLWLEPTKPWPPLRGGERQH
jgi:hypothetical protein